MRKIALLIGSSFSAAPIFFSLKKRGLEVWVCGNAKDDPCHQYADRSFYIDYSVKEQLLDLVRSVTVNYLVPSCNDYSYMSCAWVAQRCGFAGFDPYDVALVVHTKGAFRELTEAHGIPAPKARRIKHFSDLAERGLCFPVLVKPDDSFSGRGMSKVTDPDDLPKALHDATKSSRSAEAIVEEFVDGNLHSHSAFIRAGDIIFDAFVDEFCTIYPYQVDCSNHPSALSPPIRDRVRKLVKKMVTALGLADGLLHTQFIVNETDVWLIELMRRGPGDLYGKLVELSTGVDYHDLMVRPYLDEGLPSTVSAKKTDFCSRHTISVADSTVVHSFSQNIPSLDVRTVSLKKSGETLNPAPYDKLAILFAVHRDRTEMHKVTPHWADYVSIQSLD